MREIISSVVKGLLDRFDAFRYNRAHSRFWRADQGIALVLVIGTLLGVGVFAATAVTRPDADTPSLAQSDTPSLAQSNAARVSPSSRTEVVTETVKRQGRTVRVVRQRSGTTFRDAVTPPARTVRVTHTVTVREVATVTAIQPVTVTVFETVTCKPKGC